MTVLLSISNGMDAMMNDTMNEVAGGIGVYPHDAPMGFMAGGGTPFSMLYAEEIASIEHVKSAIPEVLVFVPRTTADYGDPFGVTLRGVDLEKDAEEGGPTLSSNIKEGRTVQGENEIIIGSWLVASASGDHARVGGTLVLPVIGGDSIELDVVGIFEVGNNLYDSSIYSDMDTARGLVLGIDSGKVNFIAVEADSTENVESVAQAIEIMFENEDVPVQTVVASDMLETINESMGVFHNFLWVVSLVAAIAGGISIFIVMLISVIERTKEFGILKAAGWSNSNIVGSVIVQSLSVALLGAAAGLLLGYAAGKGIDEYLNFNIATITWSLVLTIAGFGLAMGVFGGLYPALRAARVSPIESMRAV